MSEEAKNETPFYDPDPITMPVLALRGLVVYPKMMVHFDVGREASVKAVEEAMAANKLNQEFISSEKIWIAAYQVG